jgi:hypothetical protein
MNGCGKSDSPIVPVKPSNKCCGALQCAERVEERGADQWESVQLKNLAR